MMNRSSRKLKKRKRKEEMIKKENISQILKIHVSRNLGKSSQYQTQ